MIDLRVWFGESQNRTQQQCMEIKGPVVLFQCHQIHCFPEGIVTALE